MRATEVDEFLDGLFEDVMDGLDSAAPTFNPQVSGVCAEANALAGRLNAGDASATHQATQWLNQRLRKVRLEGLSNRELDTLSGCLTRVESALARHRRKRGQTARSTQQPGLARARDRIRRLLSSARANFDEADHYDEFLSADEDSDEFNLPFMAWARRNMNRARAVFETVRALEGQPSTTLVTPENKRTELQRQQQIEIRRMNRKQGGGIIR